MIRNMIVISDTHCGDQLGLCVPKIKLAHGGQYRASRFQRAVYDTWKNEFWGSWVKQVTRGEPFAVTFNGDMVEGTHHRASHPISQNKSDQSNLAYEILAPVVDLCDGRFYYISGTEAHSGEAGQDEEKLAERLGAIPDESGRRSRYEMYINVGKAHCHFSHHIGVSGSMAYSHTGLSKEYTEFCADSARWGKTVPDIIVRSHRHVHDEVRVPTHRGYGIVVVTSGWQLRTPFSYRTINGRVRTPTIGGTLIRSGDEEFYTRHFTKNTKRPKTEKIPTEIKGWSPHARI